MYYSLINSMNRAVASNPLWNNLIAYYTGDNTPNDAKGVYNGTLINGATYATGKINNGFSLDGVNDYVSLPSGTFAPTGDFSISLWFNFSALPVIKSIFNIGDFLTNSICIYIRSAGTTFLVANNSSYQVLTAPSPSFNTWYNVVCVKNITDNKYYLYINGVLSVQDTITINHILPSTPIINVGYNPAQQDSFLPGKVDELALWNKALTTTEVTELYNAGAGKQYPL